MKATNLGRKHLPEPLAKLSGCREFTLCVVGDGEFVLACNSQWGDGSWSYHQMYRLRDGAMWSLSGGSDSVQPYRGFAVVETGWFRGRDAGVTVYLIDSDVPAFFRANIPVPRGMPGKVAADYIEESADGSKSKSRLIGVAALLRLACI